jgi:predicted PurR-regulated permease PerM
MPNPSVPHNSRFVTALFLVVFFAVTYLLLDMLATYLAGIVLALVLVSLFWPVFTRIRDRVGGRARLAAGLTSALVVVLVLIPLGLLLASLSAEALDAYNRATNGDQPFLDRVLEVIYGDDPTIVRIREGLANLGVDLSPDRLREHATQAAAAVAQVAYDQLSVVAANTFNIVMHFGLMVVLMFALFNEGSRLKAYLLDLSPLPDDQEEMLIERFASISRAVFFGNGVASLLQGFFGGLGIYLFGIGSGVLFGTAIAFFAFLPIVGASIVFLPAAIYLLVTGHPGTALGYVLYNYAYVVVLEYALKPRLIGGQSQMSGVLVFVGIVAGLSLFGILGLFYGPLILTLFLTVAEIYKSQYRDDLTAIHSPWIRSDGMVLAEASATRAEPELRSEPEADAEAEPEDG